MANASLIIAGVIAAVALMVVGLVVIFHPGDNTLIVTTIFGFALAIGTGALGYRQSTEARQQSAANADAIKDTRIAVDGRMEQLLSTVKALAEKQGALDSADARAAGIKEGRDRAEEYQRVENESAAVVAATQESSL